MSLLDSYGKEIDMSRAQKKPANPGRYEGKVYLTYEESTDFLGISLSTLARYLVDEQVQTLKFHRDKKRYLKIEDVKRIEDLIKNPWKRTVPQEIHEKPAEEMSDRTDKEVA